MTYATQQNLIDRFGQTEIAQLTDRTNGTTIDATVVAKALADADAEINGYLSARYTLPLSPVPTILERLACDIARYYLFEDRVTEQVTARYDAAVKLLTNVAKGVAALGVDAASAAPAVADTVQFTPGQKVFAREEL